MVLPQEVQNRLNEFSEIVYNPKHSDPKTRELIALSNSLMINCEYCMEYHYAKAKEVGVTNEEIAEAIAIVMSVAAGKRNVYAKKVIGKLMQE
jgi:AhpD family alkylhydroperoxidase